jgi:transposase
MAPTRKNHSIQTKVKVALEAIKGEKTASEITSTYGIHISQVNNWKKQALASIPDAF